jgi:tetratricopeptide (TPR) repeat protein
MINKIIIKIFFSLLIFFSSQTFSSNIDEVLQKGNDHYKKNEFNLAVEEYQKLADKGFAGASLYYNLGNSYYRLGKIGYAILYYEKALKFSPADEDIKHNLALTKLGLKDKVDPLPTFFIFQIWEGLLAAFPVSGWTIIVYVIFIFLLIAIVAYFFANNPSKQRLTFFSGVGLLLILILTIILLAVKFNKEFYIKDGVILEPIVTAKLSPDNSAKDGFIIHEGLKVRMEDFVDDWVKIRLNDGKIGWVLKNYIGEI